MGNNQINPKDNEEIKDSSKSEDKIIQKIENRFLKRKVKKSKLTKEELEILKCLPKPENAYYCHHCTSFPLISFRISKNNKASQKCLELILLEHNFGKKLNSENLTHVYSDDNYYFSLNEMKKDSFEKNKIQKLMKEKYKKITSDDLLPFESLDDFHKYLNVVKQFLAIKEKMEYYNLGNIKNNKAYSLFEFILSNAIYGFGTLYEYLNALSIADFLTFDAIGHLNSGQNLDNGNIIFELSRNNLSLVKKVKKLNDNNLLAYIINTGGENSNYKYVDGGIFLKKFDIKRSRIYDHSEYLIYSGNAPPNKNIIKFLYRDCYQDIIELIEDSYLLQLDNKYKESNLIIADYDKNAGFYREKFHLKYVKDIICISFMKLKSKQIFLVTKSNLLWMEYDGKELKEIKKYDHSIYVDNYYEENYYCLELLNGDIVFNLESNKCCYFNVKTFSIQTIIQVDEYESIHGFNQLNDKNYFYILYDNKCCEFNIQNGRIKRKYIHSTSKESSKKLGEYYINICDNNMNIITEDNKNIYRKELNTDYDKGLLIIDEKEKIFACFTYDYSYTMSLSFYNIRKHNI